MPRCGHFYFSLTGIGSEVSFALRLAALPNASGFRSIGLSRSCKLWEIRLSMPDLNRPDWRAIRPIMMFFEGHQQLDRDPMLTVLLRSTALRC